MQMIKQPKVTAEFFVIMKQGFLGNASDLLMSQTYNNIEIVISDINSSDDSKKDYLEEKKEKSKNKG